MAVIRKFKGLHEENALERAMQEHLYQHLWLLDASWARATQTEHMERSMETALGEVCESLTDEQTLARVDVKYSTTGNKHIIIELKRAKRVLNETEIFEQLRKYYGAARAVLRAANRATEEVEILCLLGKRLREWTRDDGSEKRFRESLRAYNSRIVMYDELIENAERAYKDYLDRERESGRVFRLVQRVSERDVEMMSTT